jgi:hypothetical protein
VPSSSTAKTVSAEAALVRVASVDGKERMGGPLTEKEKNLLRELGKIAKEELEQMIVDDLPSEWRLASQMIVRDEDLLVEF